MTYFDRAIEVLDSPELLWSVAFQSHLAPDVQAIPLTLVTLGSLVEFDDLRVAWSSYCEAAGVRRAPGAFDRGLASLEGSFVSIRASDDLRFVSVGNPSVADFVASLLDRDPGEVERVITSATYFAQLEVLWAYAYPQRGRLGKGDARAGVRRALDLLGSRYADSLERLLSSPEATWRWDWHSEVRTRPRPRLPQRLVFILKLPDHLRPSLLWIEAEIGRLSGRWSRGSDDDKAVAVRLATSIEKLDGLRPQAIQSYQSNLEAWLRRDRESMDDWAPLLDYAVEQRLKDREDLVADFKDFVKSELDRWSPSPPDFSMLTEYTERFGMADELYEDIEAARERDREADDEASRLARDTDEPKLSADVNEMPSEDEQIDALFASLRDWRDA